MAVMEGEAAVSAVHLAEKGRGRALRQVWLPILSVLLRAQDRLTTGAGARR